MGGSSTRYEVANIKHPQFNSSTIIKDFDNEDKLRITQNSQETVFKDWQKYVKKNLQTIYPQFLLVPTKWDYERGGLCSSFGTLTIDFDDYHFLLSDLILQKKQKKIIFDDNDVWYLLYCLTEAKSDISSLKPQLGDIRPQNIFLNSNGKIKISNYLSWPNQRSVQQKFLKGQACYLAPERVNMLKKSSILKQTEINDQIFSIGLTLLSVCTLTNLQCLYDTKNCVFDFEGFQRKCNQFVMNVQYSEILKATILNLCNTNPDIRVDFKQLHDWIDKHRCKIKSQDNFVINFVPPQWHQQVQRIKLNISRNKISHLSSSGK